MNIKDHIKTNIYDLAIKNAKYIKLYTEEDFNNSELENQNLYLKFTKNEIQASSQEYSRKELYVNCLREKIYPLLNLSKSMILKINLHDYHEQEGILTFGSNTHSKSILIPDLYQIKNYKHSLSLYKEDNISFKNKKNKVIFGGSSTGNEFDLTKNERINTCLWSIKNKWAKEHTILKITSIVQIPLPKLNEYLIYNRCRLNQIYSDNISISEQLQYKYILSIDGNTWSWDRPVCTMNSNSLLFKYESENTGWYYPFLKENINYVSVNQLNMENKYNFFENNSNQALEIIRNSKKFVEEYCTSDAWIYYLKTLLEEINENI